MCRYYVLLNMGTVIAAGGLYDFDYTVRRFCDDVKRLPYTLRTTRPLPE